MQHALRGLPVRYAQCLSRRTSLQPHGRVLMRVLCVQRCEWAELVPAPAATAPRLRARASDARASLCRRLSHARPRRRGEACTARVAEASRDEEPADVGPSPKADEGPGAAYIIGSLAAVMGLGIANRVLYKMALQPLGNYVFFLAQCAPGPRRRACRAPSRSVLRARAAPGAGSRRSAMSWSTLASCYTATGARDVAPAHPSAPVSRPTEQLARPHSWL